MLDTVVVETQCAPGVAHREYRDRGSEVPAAHPQKPRHLRQQLPQRLSARGEKLFAIPLPDAGGKAGGDRVGQHRHDRRRRDAVHFKAVGGHGVGHQGVGGQRVQSQGVDGQRVGGETVRHHDRVHLERIGRDLERVRRFLGVRSGRCGRRGQRDHDERGHRDGYGPGRAD